MKSHKTVEINLFENVKTNNQKIGWKFFFKLTGKVNFHQKFEKCISKKLDNSTIKKLGLITSHKNWEYLNK